MIDFLMNIDGKIYLLINALILVALCIQYYWVNKLFDLTVRLSGQTLELREFVESLETRIKDLESHGK